MTITLDLPKDLIRELSSEAAQLGLPLNEYAVRLLAAGRGPQTTPKTGAELVAYWQAEGVVGTRPDIKDSPQHAREVRARAETRDWS